VSFNDHDVLIGCGAAAEWFNGCEVPPRAE